MNNTARPQRHDTAHAGEVSGSNVMLAKGLRTELNSPRVIVEPGPDLQQCISANVNDVDSYLNLSQTTMLGVGVRERAGEWENGTGEHSQEWPQ